jgi:hypothetical protein
MFKSDFTKVHIDNAPPSLQQAIVWGRTHLKERVASDADEEKMWIAGGALVRHFSGETGGDIDYFRRSDCTAIWQPHSTLATTTSFQADNSVKTRLRESSYNYDLVIQPYKNMEACLDDFDLHVAQCAVSYNHIVYGKHFFRDLATKTLTFNKLPDNPLIAFKRYEKYMKRGFTMPYVEMVKFLELCSLVDFDKLYADAIDKNKVEPVQATSYGVPF